MPFGADQAFSAQTLCEAASRRTVPSEVFTAVAFGPARMGFGLFLPAFREEFALSESAVGMIVSGGGLAFLLALLVSA